MKQSNQYIAILSMLFLGMMVFTNFNLRQSFQAIDLSDPYKNYLTDKQGPFSVLKISGSNGYPIEVRAAENNEIKTLRSRVDHVKHTIHKDTLFVEFTGASVYHHQQRATDTPPAIIIHCHFLPKIIAANIYGRVIDFQSSELELIIQDHAQMEIVNGDIQAADIQVYDRGQLSFLHQNQIDSLSLIMADESVAFLKNVNLQHVEKDLGDEVSLVLSSQVFNHLMR